MDEPILMKLYTVVVYDLRMYMKRVNLSLKDIKEDNYLCKPGISFYDILHISSFLFY